ncbi:hypothetical protein ACFRQM_46445 [Streptomyces sp. NPDC056831]|uniref:hypothetical protein n=1 Tax=Streptomyces sp. NPDC056831 TaxID=3345954 RepID=UPI0036ACEAC1
MNARKRLAIPAAAMALAGGLVLIGAGSPAGAATSEAVTLAPNVDVPYRNWAQTSGNTAGVVFHPYGDKFEIWDNVRNAQSVWVAYNYKGVNDAWKRAGSVRDQHRTVSHNLFESINGKPAYIYFKVCDTVKGCSKSSLYRTWGH